MKKRYCLLLMILFAGSILFAQEIPVAAEQQLENLADAGTEPDDDTYLQEMAYFLKHPVQLNTAGEEELKQLRILNELQVQSLLHYRRLFGPLVNMYELQAIPYWDISTIRRVLPYCTLSSADIAPLKKMFKGGEHSILFRFSQVLEKNSEYNSSAGNGMYRGSPQRLLLRYRYNRKNAVLYGITADKDAGEQFFKGAQRYGFDFYSFHFFIKNNTRLKALALGDFTVNMGQGLIQWQSLAFKKSADALAVKRQSPVLRPYTSAGEFYFYRGAGATLQQGKIQITTFVSFRKLNANVITDTLTNEERVSSLLTSGYNRTNGELADRNKLSQQTAGANIVFKQKRWHAGINAVAHRFSLPIQKQEEPYNLFAIGGNSWYNLSADYSATIRNMHFFGEAAIDKRGGKAMINGLQLSADPRLDIAVIHRRLAENYQALYGNAFTENTSPSNENGLYIGAAFRPFPGWRADIYYDIYRFPWLKYRTDAPSGGRDYLIQLTVAAGRKTEIYSRFRREVKEANLSVINGSSSTSHVGPVYRTNWRTQVAARINAALTLRCRTELVWFRPAGGQAETGFLSFFDAVYKPLLASWAISGRLQYYNTGSYDSRVYAYENDVAYSYSIPAFYGEGYRFYLVFQKDAGKNLQFWVRWAASIFQKRPGNEDVMSTSTAINGGGEIRLQTRISF